MKPTARKLLIILGLVFGACFLLLIVIGVATSLIMPAGISTSQTPAAIQKPIFPTDEAIALPTGQPQPTRALSVPEQRLLTLEWPATLRQNDTKYVQLTLAVDEHGIITPTASYEGNQIIGEPVLIPDVYETHNVMVEARLDMAGLAVQPDDLTSLSLRPGETVTFRWNVRSMEIGTFRGTVWLYLRFLPLSGGPESREALKVLDIEIEIVNFLGQGGPAARLMGWVGVALSGLIGAGDILSGFRWLTRRLRRRK
jgi:hypothetical protein